MAIKNNYLLFLIFIFNYSYLWAQIPAQKYLQLLFNKNQFENGYYEGNLTFLKPLRKKEIYEFNMLKKEDSLFWELKKEGWVQYRILCKNKFQQIFYYDKRRDLLKNFLQKDILKDWNDIPLFLFCNFNYETLIDPQKIENTEKDFYLYGRFFFPNVTQSIMIHFDKDLIYHKFILYNKVNQVDTIKFRIYFFYDQPLSMMKNKQMEKKIVSFYTKIEVINAIYNSVGIIEWQFYNPDYKVDDIRFIPDFISR
jgi:hypothetical protein